MLRILSTERGVRQEDPLSPDFLFVFLYLRAKNDVEVKGIVVHDNEYRLGQHADDTFVLLDGKEVSLRACFKLLDTFSDVSGLKINREKTKAIWIVPKKGSRNKLCPELILE